MKKIATIKLKNMKTMIYLFIAFLLLSSCEKEETHEINLEFKNYFGSYKDGSWWLLQDIISSEKDSLFIVDYSEKRESSGPKSKEYYEIIEYKLYSKDKISWAFLGVENDGSTCFDYQKINLTTSYFASFPGICKNNSINEPGCYGCGIQKIKTYKIIDYSFTDVLKIWNQTDTFYYAKNIGLIQYVDKNSNYQLIDYNINN